MNLTNPRRFKSTSLFFPLVKQILEMYASCHVHSLATEKLGSISIFEFKVDDVFWNNETMFSLSTPIVKADRLEMYQGLRPAFHCLSDV